jgi:LPXTG-motif cell wall-anchored protein
VANADYVDASVFVITELDEVFGYDEELSEDGTWSVELTFPANTVPGQYYLLGGCDNGYYENGGVYPEVAVTVTAAGGVSTPAPTPTATTAAVTGAIRGAAANTPGITSTTKGSTSAAATAPGTQITKILKGFKPGEVVTVVLHSTPTVLGTFTADANGVVTATFTVPAGTAAGSHTLVFEGNQGSYFQEAFQVAASVQTASSGLAYTGADVAVPLALGGALVLAGGGALLVSRRRTAQAPQA